jgi:DNA-directed RNA polymerase specialized sigma24 family protein
MSAFPSTHWSFIGGLVAENATRRSEHVRRFLEAYHKPLECYLAWRFPQLSDHDREDVLQDFVGNRLLTNDLYENAIAGRVNFRAYLKVSIKNFTIDYIRRQHRDSMTLQKFAETTVSPAALRPTDPLDIEWANAVMNEAVRRFRRECESDDRQVMGELFEARVLRPATTGERPPSFDELAPRFGRTPKQASNLMVSATRCLKRHLREIVRGYIAEDEAVDHEIRELRSLLQEHASSRIRIPEDSKSKHPT